MPPEKVVIYLVGLVVVLFGAYYATHFIGMKASGQTRASLRNRNIVVLDRYSISRDKCFCVVEIAGKVYIVGVAANAMTLLDTHDAKDFAELTASSDAGAQLPWGDTPVGRYGNKLTKKVVAFVASRTGKEKKGDIPKADFADSLKEAEKNLPEDSD